MSNFPLAPGYLARDSHGRYVVDDRKLVEKQPALVIKNIRAVRSAMAMAFTPDDAIEVIETMKRLAVEGMSVPAARLLLEYAVGKPEVGSIATTLDAAGVTTATFDNMTIEEIEVVRKAMAIVSKHKPRQDDEYDTIDAE